MKRVTALLALVVAAVATVVYAAQKQDQAKPAADAKQMMPKVTLEPKAMPKAVCKDPDKVIATVNGEKILEKQVFDEVQKRMDAQMKRMLAGFEIPQERMDAMRAQLHKSIAEMLVDQAVITQEIKKEKLQVTDAQVDSRIDEIAKQRNMTRDQILAQIANYGMSEQDLKD